MFQMQFLITQNVIGSSAPKDEDAPVSQAAESSAPKADNSKSEIEKICKNCKKVFLTTNTIKETCSDACRADFSRKNRKK